MLFHVLHAVLYTAGTAIQNKASRFEPTSLAALIPSDMSTRAGDSTNAIHIHPKEVVDLAHTIRFENVHQLYLLVHTETAVTL